MPPRRTHARLTRPTARALAQVLSIFLFEPIKEDMARRGWWDEEAPSTEQLLRLVAFTALPVLGPSAYVLARPSLPE